MNFISIEVILVSMAKKQVKRLYRSEEDRILGGVCAGLGKYFGVDPVLIRILWVVFSLVYGAGVLAYLIFWIIMPVEPTKKKAKK